VSDDPHSDSLALVVQERDEWIKDLQQALDEKVAIQFCEF
jgi:hypothetical protein